MRTSKTGIQKKKVDQLNNNGCRYLLALNFHKAIDEFNQILEIQEQHHDALMNKGLAHLLRGNEGINEQSISENPEDIFEAKDCFQKVLKYHGQSWEVQWCLGIIYSRLGDPHHAKQAFESATLEHQKHINDENRLSFVESLVSNHNAFELLCNHRYEKAIEKAKKLNPKRQPGTNWDAYLIQAHAHIGKGELQQASDCLSNIIKLCSCKQNAAYLMSTVHMLQGNLLSATNVLEEDIETEEEEKFLRDSVQLWCGKKYGDAIANLSRFGLMLLPMSLQSCQYRLRLLKNISSAETHYSQVTKDEKSSKKQDDNDDSDSEYNIFSNKNKHPLHETIQLQQLEMLDLVKNGEFEGAKATLEKIYSLTQHYRNPLLMSYSQFEQCILAHSIGLKLTSMTHFRGLIEKFKYNNAFKHAEKIFRNKETQYDSAFKIDNTPGTNTPPNQVTNENDLLKSIEEDIHDEITLLSDIDDNKVTPDSYGPIIQLEIDIVKLRREITAIDAEIKKCRENIRSKNQNGNQLFDKNAISTLQQKLNSLQSSHSILLDEIRKQENQSETNIGI